MPLPFGLRKWAKEKATAIYEEGGIKKPFDALKNSGTTSSSLRPSSTTRTTQPSISTSITATSNRTSTTQPPSSTSKPTSSTTAPQPTFDGCIWNVPGAGKFSKKAEWTFFGNSLPQGLQASNYIVYDQYEGANWNHRFSSDNVQFDGDFMNLVVPAVSGQPAQYPDQAVSCAEVVTAENDILYGSVRINAIFSDVPGTCHGFFFYKNDNQETDIEYLTDPQSQGNNINQSSSSGDPIPLWYSNQALRPGTPATQEIGPAPWDVTAVHEYRMDWTKTFTAFYLDGVLQKKFTTNVPNQPGYLIINNWANGDRAWSAGPPRQDNILKIQNITMYYNTTSSPGC